MTPRTLITTLLASSAYVGGSSPAWADDVHCPPNLGRVVIDGNVLVAAACVLDGTTVDGNVHIYAGGSLTAIDARIGGNIQAERADFIDVAGGRVGGSIQLDELIGDLTVIENVEIGGSVQLKANRSRLEVVGNDVGADVQAFDNRGGLLIFANVVDGNLQCKSNSPAPAGGSNRVAGNREDQCADLQPEASAVAPATTAVGDSGAADGGGGAMGMFSALLALPLLLRLRRGSRRRR